MIPLSTLLESILGLIVWDSSALSRLLVLTWTYLNSCVWKLKATEPRSRQIFYIDVKFWEEQSHIRLFCIWRVYLLWLNYSNSTKDSLINQMLALTSTFLRVCRAFLLRPNHGQVSTLSIGKLLILPVTLIFWFIIYSVLTWYSYSSGQVLSYDISIVHLCDLDPVTPLRAWCYSSCVLKASKLSREMFCLPHF